MLRWLTVGAAGIGIGAAAWTGRAWHLRMRQLNVGCKRALAVRGEDISRDRTFGDASRGEGRFAAVSDCRAHRSGRTQCRCVEGLPRHRAPTPLMTREFYCSNYVFV